MTLENYCAVNVVSDNPEWGEIAKPRVASECERTLGFIDARDRRTPTGVPSLSPAFQEFRQSIARISGRELMDPTIIPRLGYAIMGLGYPGCAAVAATLGFDI